MKTSIVSYIAKYKDSEGHVHYETRQWNDMAKIESGSQTTGSTKKNSGRFDFPEKHV